MPQDEEPTCATCVYHAPAVATNFGLYGECRAEPPTVPSVIPRAMAYRLTADDLPACRLYHPKVEPEPVVAETKAEKIERLKRDGVTDLVAWKRAIEGR